MVSNGAPRQRRRVAEAVALVAACMAGCGPGKDEPSATDATSGTTGTSSSSTSIGPGSLSHSATSATPPTTGPPVTTDPPTSTSGPVTSTTLETTSPTSATTGPTSATSEAVTGGSSSAGTTGGPGIDAYGPCQQAEPNCPGDQTCIMLRGIDGEFCAPPCSMDMQCPQVDGGAMAVCALVLDQGMEPTHCALLCDPLLRDPGCPPGSSCKTIPMQMVGVCTVP